MCESQQKAILNVDSYSKGQLSGTVVFVPHDARKNTLSKKHFNKPLKSIKVAPTTKLRLVSKPTSP